MFNSIWCEEVKVPAEFKEGTRLVYTFINGKNEKGYTFAEVSSFLATVMAMWPGPFARA